MLFVDGENLAKRAADVAGSLLVPGPHFRKDVFVWMPGVAPKVNPIDIRGGYSLEDHGLRAHYFTAMSGDDLALTEMRDLIRGCGFHPEVFKKRDGEG